MIKTFIKFKLKTNNIEIGKKKDKLSSIQIQKLNTQWKINLTYNQLAYLKSNYKEVLNTKYIENLFL